MQFFLEYFFISKRNIYCMVLNIIFFWIRFLGVAVSIDFVLFMHWCNCIATNRSNNTCVIFLCCFWIFKFWYFFVGNLLTVQWLCILKGCRKYINDLKDNRVSFLYYFRWFNDFIPLGIEWFCIPVIFTEKSQILIFENF